MRILSRLNVLELGILDASRSLGWLRDVVTLFNTPSITNTVALIDKKFGAQAVVTDIGIDFQMTNASHE